MFKSCSTLYAHKMAFHPNVGHYEPLKFHTFEMLHCNGHIGMVSLMYESSYVMSSYVLKQEFSLIDHTATGMSYWRDADDMYATLNHQYN